MDGKRIGIWAVPTGSIATITSDVCWPDGATCRLTWRGMATADQRVCADGILRRRYEVVDWPQESPRPQPDNMWLGDAIAEQLIEEARQQARGAP